MKNSELFDFDIITAKQYGDHTVKVTYLPAVRKAGIENDEKQGYSPKGTVNTEKLDNNLARAKSKCKELALCNPWRFWCTFTISPEKYDRYNLKEYTRDLYRFIQNYNRYCTDLEKVTYLLIPEMHKDGAWHMHGFINGIKDKDLYKNKFGHLTWKQYENKFGFISMSEIKDSDKASSYALKYMTKDTSKNVSDLGAHLYYASKGLKTAQVLYKGHAELHCPWDWEHPDGYCKVKTIDTREHDLGEFLEITP